MLIRSLLCTLLVCAAAHAQPLNPPVRLVVVLVVDQMVPDYFHRYGDLYQGGLARLARDGTVFDRAYHDQSCTLTGPGHATLSTGALPARHGIVGNYWFERAAGREVYSCADSTSPVVGHPELNGVSPARLEASTFAELLRKQMPGSRVVSMALKDRAAVLMAGRKADLVLWLEEVPGRMVTSRWYSDTLPGWVTEFQPSLVRYADSVWTKLLPDSAYRRSGPDHSLHEHGGTQSTFPHACNPEEGTLSVKYFEELYIHPYGDQLILELAQRAVDSMKLGLGPHADLLLIGCSAADGTGHVYGPDSHEVQDYYLRLDRWLGEFFDHLDSAVGQNRWLAALSSDHGVLSLPEVDAARGVASERVLTDTVKAQIEQLSAAVSTQWGVQLEALRVDGGLAFKANAWDSGGAWQQAVLDLAARVRTLDWVADVYTRPELANPETPVRPYLRLFQNAYHDQRGPDLFIREHERVIVTSGKSGTTHGSPYSYDTHVPLILMGPGIPAVHVTDSVRTVDLAPTLCDLLGVSRDASFDGASLADRLR